MAQGGLDFGIFYLHALVTSMMVPPLLARSFESFKMSHEFFISDEVAKCCTEKPSNTTSSS